MPIPLDELRNAARRQRPMGIAKSLQEAKAAAQSTAFLCHSHKDETLAKGLQIVFAEVGSEVYIDWQDTALPPEPNQVTAEKIRKKITDLDLFLFLATPNSVASRWCPWEIGYADSRKPLTKIYIITTSDSNGWYGNEYLKLYREIDYSEAGKLCAFPAGTGDKTGILLEDLR
jgi:hypothetical protein